MWAFLYTAGTVVCSAAAASAFLWYGRPDILVNYFMKLMTFKLGARVKFVQHEGRTYCYAERGQYQKSRSSIVLVHGFSSSKHMWLSILQRLPKDLHIVIVDLPGHGQSHTPGIDKDFTIVTITDYLHELMIACGMIDKSVHLVGTSMGGGLAALYAAMYPEYVDKLTLICPAMRTPVTTQFLHECEHESVEKCKLIPSTVDGMKLMMEMCMHKKLSLKRQFIKGCLDLRLPKNDWYRKFFEMMNAEGNMDLLLEKLPMIKAPTHVVWGKDDQILHISGVEVLKERVQTLEQIDLIEDCGHSVCMDHPGQLTKVLLKFRNEYSEAHKENKTE